MGSRGSMTSLQTKWLTIIATDWMNMGSKVPVGYKVNLCGKADFASVDVAGRGRCAANCTDYCSLHSWGCRSGTGSST